MASLEKYRACIQRLLTERAQQGGDQWVEAQTIFDTERDHYQLLYTRSSSFLFLTFHQGAGGSCVDRSSSR
jgi:hypothetical protein